MFVLLPLLLLPVPHPPAARAQDLAAQYWNQDASNPLGDRTVDVEPLASPPVLRWEQDFADGLLAGPVLWGRHVFVCVAKGKGRADLLALDLESGEVLAHTKLPDARRLSLAVSNDLVLVDSAAGLATHRLKKGRFFLKKKRKDLQGLSPPLVDGDEVFLRAGRLHRLSLNTLKDLDAAGDPGLGRPCVGSEQIAQVFRSPVSQGLEIRFCSRDEPSLYTFRTSAFPAGDGEEQACSLLPFGGFSSGFWFVRGPQVWIDPKSNEHFPAFVHPDHLSPIVSLPIPWKDGIVGFDAEGNLLLQKADGAHHPLFAKDSLPPGSQPGRITRARGVAFAGNFALELESGRVLWCLPEMDPSWPSIPVAGPGLLHRQGANGLRFYSTATLRDPSVAAAQPPRNGKEDPPPSPSAPLRRLDEGDGILLADGSWRPGTYHPRKEGWILEARKGESSPPPIPQEQVLLWIEGEGTRLYGEEWQVYRGWRRFLDEECRRSLLPHFQAYRKLRFLGDCRRILEDLAHFRLPEERAQELLDQLSGLQENRRGNAARQRQHWKEQEDRSRKELAASLLRAAHWSAQRGLHGVATLLLGDLEALQCGMRPDPQELLAQVPDSFPDFLAQGKERGLQWLRWARRILPAGAAFLAAEDPLFLQDRGPYWKSEALVLRSEDLLLLSKSYDPEVVGACLRNGEVTVRTLEDLFPAARRSPEGHPLELRIFPDRESYLAEAHRRGNRGMDWSLGYYSNGDGVSRFYVPRKGDHLPDGRGLQRVLAHELTHHFLDQRGLAGDRSGRGEAGYWIVEGFASFIGDQVPEIARKGRALDDPTVGSVDACVQIQPTKELLPLERLLSITSRAFAGLGDDPSLTVTLRYQSGIRAFSERAIFYEESAALVFYLMNHRGEEGRKALLDYLAAYYAGRIPQGGAPDLLLPDSGNRERALRDLEDGFLAFLDSLQDP